MMQPYRGRVGEYGFDLQEFGGLNEGIRINENEFSDMLNMSSGQYPLASTRGKRLTVMEYIEGAEVVGFYCKDAIVTVIRQNGSCKLYINNNEVDGITLLADDNMCPKNIVGMGAYIVIFPDKVYLNMLDYTDKGSLENVFRQTAEMTDSKTWITFVPCMIDGEQLQNFSASSVEPQNPKNGDVWSDTSKETSVFKVWDEATKQWQQMGATYVRIGCKDIGKGFSKWDGVKLSVPGISVAIECEVDEGFNASAEPGDQGYDIVTGKNKNMLWTICNQSNIIHSCGDDYIVVAGILNKVCAFALASFKLSRECPVPEIVVEHNNRLWGCRYGKLEDGKIVNEIYACRQGDFKNWNAYLGISTDSYAVSVGTDGPFTGATIFAGYPIFFKEDCIHKIYGSMPSNYQVVTTQCRGVKKGQNKSLVTVNNTLFYCSPVDYCAYDGALPAGISDKLTRRMYEKVIGGGIGDKVYFYAEKKDGTKELLVFDTLKGIWHKEEAEKVVFYSRDGHILYYVTEKDGIYAIKSVNEDCDVNFTVNGKNYPVTEENFNWRLESGDIGFADLKYKSIRKVAIRARLHKGARLKLYMSCDGQVKELIGSINRRGFSNESFSMPPKRCDSFRYIIEGEGQAEIISLDFAITEGSERG